jgi:ubiquinone/menaquinone biosynthesis C-methylase UbiE
MKNKNKEIFTTHHSRKNLQHLSKSSYDKNFIDMKATLLRKYTASNDLNILDLCCGTGEYSRYIDTIKNSYFGVDFALNMLAEFKDGPLFNEALCLSNSDANKLPFVDNKIDVCFSFSSLYYFDNVALVLREINRVLSDDGIAVLEFATKNNINAHVSNYWAINSNWGFPYFISYDALMVAIKEAGFVIIEERNFELFPVLRGPWWSICIANSFLKPLLKIKIKGKTFDEYISSKRLLKRFAFKHFIVLSKNYDNKNYD